MTDEQTKQNADNYTESLMCENLHRTMYSSIDFIAGAHSRDEEIKELKEEIESLRKGFYERGDKLKELMLANNKLRNDNKDLEQALACSEDVVDIQRKELDQLRNPWISVEERLPDDMQKVIWVRKDGQYFFGHFHNHDNGRLYFVSTEAVTDVTGEWRDRVTHWMLIPKLKEE